MRPQGWSKKRSFLKLPELRSCPIIYCPIRVCCRPLTHPVLSHPNATVIGDVHVGEGSNIWFGCVLRGDVHEIRIGKRTNIQDLTMVHVARNKFGTYIGDDITIGHSAIIHAATLEDGCFVGMGATVMDGAVIESKAMLGAGSFVGAGQTHSFRGALDRGAGQENSGFARRGNRSFSGIG